MQEHAVNTAISLSRRGACPVLVFDVGDHPFAIPAKDVAEILPMAELSCAGCNLSVLAGFLNLAGDPLPVLSTANLMEIHAEPPGPEASIIVVKHPGGRFGFLAHAVRQITPAAPDAIVPLASPVRTESAARIDGRIIPILALDELVLRQEQARIKELRLSYQQRLQQLPEAAA